MQIQLGWRCHSLLEQSSPACNLEDAPTFAATSRNTMSIPFTLVPNGGFMITVSKCAAIDIPIDAELNTSVSFLIAFFKHSSRDCRVGSSHQACVKLTHRSISAAEANRC